MQRNPQDGDNRRLRPVDLARGHGLSAQAVRNYEADGILPTAERTPHGYRVYTSLHAQALRAFLALVSGFGHQTAAAILCAVNEGALENALRLIDSGHAQLLADRRTLEAVERALRHLEDQPAVSADEVRAAAPETMLIGPLADELGVRPATLRAWERAGLVRPHRDRRTGYRVYAAADVRDARLVHQLRRGGYLLEQIAPLIGQVRAAGGLEPLQATLRDWHDRLSARGRAMLSGAAELEAYLCVPRDRGERADSAGAGSIDPADQAWFRTPTWQARIAEAEADRLAGNSTATRLRMSSSHRSARTDADL